MSAGSAEPFRAVVFDLDGTLVDSAPDVHAAASIMLAELGRPPLPLEMVTGFIGNGVARLVERCLTATGGDDAALRDRALAAFDTAYGAAPAVLSRPYPGIASMLRDLRAAGLRLAVCTNKPQAIAEQVLADLSLARWLDAIVGGGGGRPLKPDPAALRLCLERLVIDIDACLYVGDSEIDAATAAAAGATFALFSGGYRRGPAEAIPAVFTFAAFADLTAFAVGGRAA